MEDWLEQYLNEEYGVSSSEITKDELEDVIRSESWTEFISWKTYGSIFKTYYLLDR